MNDFDAITISINPQPPTRNIWYRITFLTGIFTGAYRYIFVEWSFLWWFLNLLLLLLLLLFLIPTLLLWTFIVWTGWNYFIFLLLLLLLNLWFWLFIFWCFSFRNNLAEIQGKFRIQGFLVLSLFWESSQVLHLYFARWVVPEAIKVIAWCFGKLAFW